MNVRCLPLLEVLQDVSRGNAKTPQRDFLAEGNIPVIDQGKQLIAGYTNDPDRVCKTKPPVIVFGDHTRAIKFIDFEFAMGADGTKVLAPKVECDLKYFYHALRANRIPNAGYSRHFKFLKEVKLPVPPLADQKRIAAILDAADALRAKRRETLAQLDTLLQSTFLEMFGDPVINAKAWPVCTFDRTGTFLSGSTPRKDREDFWNGLIPWVSPKDMKLSEINDSIDHVSELAFAESNLKLLDPGHVLIVVRGMILAHSFPVGINRVPVAINQDMKAISPVDQLNPVYLRECIRNLKRKILAEISTAGHGTKRFDSNAMKKVLVPMPPESLQNHFATIIQSVEDQKNRLRAHLDELDTLFASLQARAFAGEL